MMKEETSELNYERFFGNASIFSGKCRIIVGVTTELIGTYFITFLGLLACLVHSQEDYNLSTINIAMSFSLAYLTSSMVFRKLGTCHFNPAFSLVALFLGDVSLVYCFLSFIAQLVGAVLATFTLQILLPQLHIKFTTMEKPYDITLLAVGAAEFFGTLLILSCKVVSEVDSRLKNSVVSLAIFISTLVFLPYGGGSMNPVRAFGPSLATGNIPDYYWIYWVGPLGASFFVMLLYFGEITRRGVLKQR